MPAGFNPYAPPGADLNPVRAPSSKRTGWKIYAWGLAAFLIGAFVFTLPEMGVTDVVDYAVSTVGIVGLFGFAYRRPLLRRQVWALWSVLLPAWDVVMGAWLHSSSSGTTGRVGYFVAMTLLLPEYLALARYAYRSPQLWYQPARP